MKIWTSSKIISITILRKKKSENWRRIANGFCIPK